MDHFWTFVGSVTALPSAGHDRQYVPSCVPIQIRFRSNSTKPFSVVPRHQDSYLLMSPSRGGTNQATSFGAVGSEMSNMRMPALNQVITTIAGLDVPGASQHCVLCEPKRPRAKQKSEYGASGGAAGRGKKPMIFVFFRSFTSIM